MSLKEYLKEDIANKEIVEKAWEVVEDLQNQAAKLLQLQKEYEMATGHRTDAFNHFAQQILEVVSTDNGEAGLEAMLKNWSKG